MPLPCVINKMFTVVHLMRAHNTFVTLNDDKSKLNKSEALYVLNIGAELACRDQAAPSW